MIYLSEFQHIENKGLKATFVHNFPFDELHGLGKTIEELEVSGILIDSLPTPSGEVIGIFVNKESKEVTYEYSEVATP